jgi:hypothetical protein
MELYAILFEEYKQEPRFKWWHQHVTWDHHVKKLLHECGFDRKIVCLLIHSILSLNFFALPLPAILSSHWTLVTP